jgi:hypothetical protein
VEWPDNHGVSCATRGHAIGLHASHAVCHTHNICQPLSASYSAGGQRLIQPISPHLLQRVAVYAYHHVAMRM